MKDARVRGALLALAALTALAMVPAAEANFTRVGDPISGTSTRVNFIRGNNSRCPRNDLTGTITGATRISIRLAFAGDGRVTCDFSGGLFSMRVTCAGELTLNATSSVAGTSARGDVNMDAGFTCSLDVVNGNGAGRNCTLTIDGPQGPFAGGFTYNQRARTLELRLVRVTARGTPGGGVCATGPMDVIGVYNVTTPLTIS